MRVACGTSLVMAASCSAWIVAAVRTSWRVGTGSRRCSRRWAARVLRSFASTSAPSRTTPSAPHSTASACGDAQSCEVKSSQVGAAQRRVGLCDEARSRMVMVVERVVGESEGEGADTSSMASTCSLCTRQAASHAAGRCVGTEQWRAVARSGEEWRGVPRSGERCLDESASCERWLERAVAVRMESHLRRVSEFSPKW
jgi:hypothetical protein